MTTLDQILDLDNLKQYIEAGYIRENTHPNGILRLLNYSEKSQYERFWPHEVLVSRGLIYRADSLEVVARGFDKFFSWDDTGQPYPPQGPMVLSTKFDGSLGILYRRPDGLFRIATRGSFSSDQALHASSRFISLLIEFSTVYGIDMGEEFLRVLDQNATPVFEIIYPQNRIVVDYNGEDRLVLLDVIDNATGMSRLDLFDSIPWPDKAEKRLIPGGFSDSLTHTIPEGEEGFVLYWPGSGFRCKMKSAAYVELHRMVTGLSEKTLWEALGRGETIEQIKENVPDELFAWVDEKATALYEKAGAILDQAQDDFNAVLRLTVRDAKAPVLVPGSETQNIEIARAHRPIFARHAASYPATRPYLFKILDGADESVLWSMAWKTTRPVGDTRVWNQSSEEA